MKFNKNIILFAAVMIFILAGFTAGLFGNIKYQLLSFLIQNEDGAENLSALFAEIDDISTDELRYHDEMMNLDSIKQRLMDTKVIQKSADTTIVRTDCDSLIDPQSELFTEENLELIADQVAQLQQKAQAHGAGFLYAIAPRKTHAMEVPEHVADYRKENLSALVDKLDEKKVNTLNLCEILREENRLDETLFFKTDHHWKPETGFWAAGEICRDLNERYGFEYDTQATDLSNYDVKVYKDWFLGSYGKKTGMHFVSGGAEDFSLITPKFETDFTAVDPYQNLELSGDFRQALLYMDNINECDYYEKNTYGVYRLGVNRLQTVKNNLKQDGKKILLIQDSFGCVVAPFLALNASELHIVDIRSFLNSAPVNVYDYIEQFQPDYVMILYAGLEDLPDGCGRYDFNPNP